MRQKNPPPSQYWGANLSCGPSKLFKPGDFFLGEKQAHPYPTLPAFFFAPIDRAPFETYAYQCLEKATLPFFY